MSTRSITPEDKRAGACPFLGPPLKVAAKAKAAEVEELFSRSGEEALVVEEGGHLLGLLSRLVWEKARSYNLSLRPAELAFVVPQAPCEAPGEVLFRLLKNPLQRVFRGGGLFSVKEFWALGLAQAPPRKLSLAGILARLREELLSVARHVGARVFLVGGAVRDLLLEREVFDLDFVVTRDSETFARVLSERLGARLLKSSLFKTFKLSWEGLEIDLAQARWEYYESPAKLPKVAPGPLSWDLFRRDFTINALALDLETLILIDLYGGERDLEDGRLEVLHVLSFVDDPTRIFRAARYATRFALETSPNLERALGLARKLKVLALLSPARLQTEIKRILQEKDPILPFAWLKERGVLSELCGEEPGLAPLERVLKDPHFESLKDDEKLAAVLLALSPREEFLKRFALPAGKIAGYLRALDLLREKGEFLSSSRVPLSEKVFLLEKEPVSAILVFKALHPALKEEIDAALAARDVRPLLTGKDLQRMGLRPGPLCGEILKRLRAARIDGLLKDREGEISFLKKEYPDVFAS